MKLPSSLSSSLTSHAKSIYQTIQKRFCTSVPTQTQILPNGSRSESLFRRISPLGNPNVTILPVLEQWIEEGNRVYKPVLQNIIRSLQDNKRYKHALELSQWMTDKRNFSVDSVDHAQRMNLIFRVHGLEAVENYFNNIPEKVKSSNVVKVALLKCYANAKCVEKAEAIMKKAKDNGHASRAKCYAIMMNLYYDLGNWHKLNDLINEMEVKSIRDDKFTLCTRLRAYAAASDHNGVDKIVNKMQSDAEITLDWVLYSAAAQAYLTLGLVDKALVMLNELEKMLSNVKKGKDVVYACLIKLYAESGSKDKVYAIWNQCKQDNKAFNKVYMTMMSSLMKFDDIDGVEKIFEEWGCSSGLSYDIRVPNWVIDAYCRNGFLEKAESVIQCVVSKGGRPNVTMWKHMAGGCLMQNEIAKAADALKKAILVDGSDDTMITCLEYLESGKDTEFVGSLRVDGSSSKDVIDRLFCFINRGK